MAGGVAYLVSSDISSITAVDISDPSNPVELGRLVFRSGGGCTKIVLSGKIAFVTSTTSGTLSAIDISDPSNMTTLGNLSSANISNPVDFAIKDSVAFVVSANYLTAVNIANPASMSELQTVTTAAMNGATRVAISGNTAFVTGNTLGNLTAINIQTPVTMSVISTLTDGSLDEAWGVAVYGNYAYVTSASLNRVQGVDITNPSAMSLSGFAAHNDMTTAKEIVISDGVAYVSVLNGDPLFMIDVSTAPISNSSIIGSIPTTEFTRGYAVAAEGGIACVIGQLTYLHEQLFVVQTGSNPLGDDVGLYNFKTGKYDDYMEVTITRISDGFVMAEGELYTPDENGYIDRYFGTGGSTGADRIVYIGDGNVYIFTASYTHTNGVVPATDLRDTYLDGYGFTYLYPTRDTLPYDTKQYSSVKESGSQGWTTQADRQFQGVALGRIAGDTVSVVFKDDLGSVVASVTDYAIPCKIDPIFDDEPATVILYATVNGVLQTIPAGGKVEVTVAGTAGTELGMIFPFGAYEVGVTDLSFSHEIKNFDRDRVSEVSGAVDHIKGNRYSVHNGSFHIEMANYDKMVLVNKKIVREFIAIDGSDTLGNEVADGIGRFASTKLIGRIEKLGMDSKAKNGKLPKHVPVTIRFTEAV